jgi:hypothetical protein
MYLIALIPLIGGIWLFVLFVQTVNKETTNGARIRKKFPLKHIKTHTLTVVLRNCDFGLNLKFAWSDTMPKWV